MFGEDLIGCLFTKSNWVIRETALRHLSKEIVMQLSTLSPATDNDSSPSSPALVNSPVTNHELFTSDIRPPNIDTHIDQVLRLSCEILAMMVGDPVYKVYVSSLVCDTIIYAQIYMTNILHKMIHSFDFFRDH